jgi:ssDNA-binding Zn-finger/Zn-ribbon topoisomerase 1
MRVVKKSYETQITCTKCKAELIYDSGDIHLEGDMEGEWGYCVTCPECGKNIKVL